MSSDWATVTGLIVGALFAYRLQERTAVVVLGTWAMAIAFRALCVSQGWVVR